MSQLAYLGPPGSQSHLCASQVAEALAMEPSALVPKARIAVLVDSPEELALLPVENSIGGSVPESLDCMLAASPDLRVILEWVMPVEHCLAGYGSPQELREIRGHHQAISQCAAYLDSNFPSVGRATYTSSTAALMSLDPCTPTKAAICSCQAARMYGVPLLDRGINDSPDNVTRFWLLCRHQRPVPPSDQKLCSITFTIPQDAPGGLLRVLASHAKRGINLTKIESRPTKGRLGDYHFLLDFLEPSPSPQGLSELLSELSFTVETLRVLGCYPVLPLGDTRFPSLPV